MAELTFRCDIDDASDGFTRFGFEVLARGVAWRCAITQGSDGPTVGLTESSDVIFDPMVIVNLAPVVIDRSLIDSNRLDPRDLQVGADELDPWVWFRRVIAGDVSGPEADTLMRAFEQGSDSSEAVMAIDAIVGGVVESWCRTPEGTMRVSEWAASRESERRGAVRRLDGLRRRHDRDLLVLADRIGELRAEG
jgi:hypothetical protein